MRWNAVLLFLPTWVGSVNKSTALFRSVYVHHRQIKRGHLAVGMLQYGQSLMGYYGPAILFCLGFNTIAN
jgi:hypothetical protein